MKAQLKESESEIQYSYRVDPVSVAMGARVEGLDVGEDQSQETIDLLRDLMLKHHLLVLPNQQLSAHELEAFGRRWGSLLTHPATKHRDTQYVQWIGSSGEGRKFKFFPGSHPAGGGWHSDMTWHSTPPKYTGLLAKRLPNFGGDTIFSNQHLAFDTLPDELKEDIADKSAFHTGKVFGPDVEDSIHPVVRTHDETGEKALYVNPNFTKYIVGMPADESEALLFRIFSHHVRPEFTYRHKWSVNDLVLWDNRSVMHYAIADYNEQRIMHRIVVQGNVPQ
ncbi:MAG: TauD/TfdA family dioxygenase [Gammaproteobacteria bacterium]|nr:TauD/TfdA family dioxygenase [Gammaproteobacteria bacterium]